MPVSTIENHCLEEKLTFGDPFLDSGVVQHLAHPEGCAALRIVLVTAPRVSRSCEHFPDGFDLQ